jgi:copper oxidase (laccase) domain-containing protein
LARQLEGLGIATQVSPTCTAESPHLFSHRRDGVTGRQAAYAMLG